MNETRKNQNVTNNLSETVYYKPRAKEEASLIDHAFSYAVELRFRVSHELNEEEMSPKRAVR